MYSRNEPIPVRRYQIIYWQPVGRSGAYIQDGYYDATDYRPASEIFPGLNSRGRVLSRREKVKRSNKRIAQARSRKANR